jgi:hypothetical protein
VLLNVQSPVKKKINKKSYWKVDKVVNFKVSGVCRKPWGFGTGFILGVSDVFYLGLLQNYT